MKNGLSKKQSVMLQGIAIMMMLYHHLFSTPDALGISYTSLLSFIGEEAELRLAWFFKICVGMYAFITGYGMVRSYALARGQEISENFGLFHSKCETGFLKTLVINYKVSLKKLAQFYLFFYWPVFIIYMAVGFIFFKKEFLIGEFLLNLLGISSSYNGAWWYVLQYVKMLLTLPVIDACFVYYKYKKDRITAIIIAAAGIITCAILYLLPTREALLSAIEFFQPAYYLCFIMGFLISRFCLYELADLILDKYLPKAIYIIVAICAIIAVMALRIHMAKDASSAGFDFIFVPVFIFGAGYLLSLEGPIAKALSFIGSLSTYMWLIHVFYYDHYAKNIVMFSRFSLGIYLTLVLMSGLSAYIFKTLIGKVIKSVKIRKR